MEHNRKNIDDLFKEELGNYAETPPPQAWDALEKRLGKIPPGAGTGILAHVSKYFLIASAAVVLGVSVSRKIASNDNNILTNRNAPIALNTGRNTTENTTSSNNNITTSANYTAQAAAVGTTPSGSNIASQPTNSNTTNNTTSGSHATAPTGTIDNNIAARDNNHYNDKNGVAKPGITNSNGHSNNTPIAENNNKYTATKAADHATSAHSDGAASIAKTSNRKSKKTKAHTARNGAATRNGFAATSSKETNQDNAIANDFNKEGNDNTPSATDNYNSSPIAKNNDLKTIPPVAVNAAPQLPGTFKETKTEAAKQADADPLMKKHAEDLLPVTKLSRIEVGIKAGYEGGLNSSAGKKVVVSPYVQYSLSSKISLMVQPAIKYAHINNKPLSGSQSFYKENSDSSAVVSSKSPVYIESATDSFFIEKITYSQSHDSIVKTYTTGGAYMEFELPVLVKYAVSKKCSFYGGFTMTYGNYVGITEHTYISSPIVKSVTGNPEYIFPPNGPVFSPVNSQITYSGNEISTYKGPLYAAPSGGLFRVGYMLGFNYAYNKRWLFDVLMQQSSAGASSVGGYNTTSPFSALYFRITLGYKLF